MQSQMECVEPVSGFGIAEVVGLEPGLAATPEQARVRELLARHGVVCIRQSRPLDEAELLATVEWFGPLKAPVAPAKHGGEHRYGPDLQVMDSGRVLDDQWKQLLGGRSFGGLDPQRPGLFETWHVDDTFTPNPAAATVLHARELPPSGGGPTCFADMRAALEQLDRKVRSRIESLDVLYAYDNEDAFFPPRRRSSGPSSVLVDVAHPLVRTHPVAGTQSLFIDLDRAKHVIGLPVEEGRNLLRQLQEHAEERAPRCEHEWRDHDVLVWDNASVQHRASGNFKVGEPRRFWRHLVSGASPRR